MGVTANDSSRAPGHHDRLSARGLIRIARTGAIALLIVGSGLRLAPLLIGGERVLNQFPTEDAYLMLTISRNLATGLGFTTAAGSIETNGTQPLATFLWSAAFWIANGDRWLGVLIVQIPEILLSAAIAFALFRFARRLLEKRQSKAVTATQSPSS